MNTFDIQIISSQQEIQEIQLEWEHFLKYAATSYTFWQDPNIIRFHLKPEEEPRIIILRKEGKIECIAPFTLNRQNHFYIHFSIFKLKGPKSCTLKLIGNDFIFSKKADTNICIYNIFNVIANSLSFSLIEIENMAVTSAICTKFSESKFKFSNFKLSSTSPKMEKNRKHILQKTYDTWLKSLRGKTRGKILRRSRSLHKKFKERVHISRISGSNQVADFLNELNELFPKTWQAKTYGNYQRNTQHDIEYYQYLCGKGWLRSYLLSIDDQGVAFLIGFQYRGTFLHAECGYDPNFANVGVGSVLNYFTLEDLYCTNKPTELDFGFGENEYKKILGNFESDAFSGWITLPGVWRNAVHLQKLISLLEDKIRNFITSLKLDRTVRKLLKRK